MELTKEERHVLLGIEYLTKLRNTGFRTEGSCALEINIGPKAMQLWSFSRGHPARLYVPRIETMQLRSPVAYVQKQAPERCGYSKIPSCTIRYRSFELQSH
jgi:hypothetical protein